MVQPPLTQNIRHLFNLSRQVQWPCFFSESKFILHLQQSTDLITPLSIHPYLLKSGSLSVTFTTTNLMNAYIRVGEITCAQNLLNEMPEPNVVSWSALMSGYINTGEPRMALRLFINLLRTEVLPNAFTFSTAIYACTSLGDIQSGRTVHAHVQLHGYHDNLVVCSSLIDMYGKSNDLDSGRRVFDSMEQKNVISWTSMIVGYAQNARGYESLQLLRDFNRVSPDPPNQFMLSAVVNACSSLGRLAYGMAAHTLIIKRGHEPNEVVACSLIDMYAKCGCIESSGRVFGSICYRSVIPYTCMIIGAAKHGLGELALELFHDMLMNGVKPNKVTFIGVLYACSHSGLANQGLEYLDSMHERHGVVPDSEHYNCVVDMLGRTGRLDEAYNLAKSIKVSEDQGVLMWATLLSASRLHGRVDIATEASKWLVESKQQVASAYVTMSNVYASAGSWEDACSSRAVMRQTGVTKEPGCSWVEIKGLVYAFYAGDVASCPRGEEVLVVLKELGKRMKERGFVGAKGLVFIDVEEEAKEEIVSLHSERLALGFCLISVPEGVSIRIMKNLRMCGDCHEVFKLVSEIVCRDFVVRDVNRFHHFVNGSCSCKDFW